MNTQNTIAACLLILVFNQCKTKQSELSMPAEWEKQEAVLLTYTEDPNDVSTSSMVRSTCDELIEVMAKKIKVYVLINDDKNADSLTSYSQLARVCNACLICLAVARVPRVPFTL